MATHRDSGPAEAGAPSYPGQAYQDVDYPSAAPGYPAGRDGDRRYAERIPRYPESTPPDAAEPTGRHPGSQDELRLTDEDRGRPRPSAVESPTTYQPVSPAAPPSSPAAPQPQLPPQPQPSQQLQQPTPPQQPTPQHPAAPQQSVPQQPAAQQPAAQQPAAQQSPPHQQVPTQPAAPQRQANAALSDLLHEPTQLTEQVPVYPAGGTGAGTVHRSHAQLSWLFGALAILFDVPVAVVLVRSLMSGGVMVGGVVSGLLLLPGLPLLAAGFYQLFSGRLVVRPGEGLGVLTRRPFALLFAGVVLVLAGAMAAG